MRIDIDLLLLSHKNANGCGDKSALSQRWNIPILTIWSPADCGKCEIDPRGADFAKTARVKLVDDCLEDFLDPRDCRNLRDKYNATQRKPSKARKNSRVVDREAFHNPRVDIQQLRYTLPAFETLVTLIFRINQS